MYLKEDIVMSDALTTRLDSTTRLDLIHNSASTRDIFQSEKNHNTHKSYVKTIFLKTSNVHMKFLII